MALRLAVVLGDQHQGGQGEEAEGECNGDSPDQFFFAVFATGCHGWQIMKNPIILKPKANFDRKMLVCNRFRGFISSNL